MARKKVLLFVVEGPTEELALGLILTRLFSAQNEVRFEIMHGDITTQWGIGGRVSSDDAAFNVGERLRKSVIDYLGQTSPRLSWRDLGAIVQITDTDSAFVPDEEVSCDEGHRGDILDRNHMKQKSVRRLLGRSSLTYQKRSVPYALYYFSRNMEHALSNREGECSEGEKVDLARAFRQRYKDDLQGFLDFLDTLLPSRAFAETWEHVFEGANSRKRCSNLRLALPDAGSGLN